MKVFRFVSGNDLIRVEHFGLQESHASVQAAVSKDQATSGPGHVANTHFRVYHHHHHLR